MTYLSDAAPVSYMADGAVLPGETLHNAMAANTAHALAGHLLTQPIQGVTSGPQVGHGFEHQPVNAAEQAAQHTAQNAAQDGPDAPDGDQDGDAAQATFNHAAVASSIRQSIRPGVGA